MDNEDEILIEQYFPYRNMTIDERNLCINLLLNTKDICDSEISINEHSSSIYDILFMNLSKTEEGAIRFDGATYNDDENMLISWFFVRSNNKYYVRTDVFRFNDVLQEEDKEYSITDEFIFKNGKVYRRSRYTDSCEFFESEVRLLNGLELDEYLESKVRKFRK